jgi:hypothetical protein
VTEADAPPHHDAPSPDAPAPAPDRALPPLRRGREAAIGISAAALLILALAVVAALRDSPPATRTGNQPAPPVGTGPVHIERLAHAPGDCLTWDQAAGVTPVARATTPVPCDTPHLVEITGQVTIPTTDGVGPGPTPAELDEMTDRLCLPVNEAHLGGPLDPHGRYYAAGIQPSPESWRSGDREVWCALGAHDGTEDPFAEGDGRHRPFSGAVASTSQHWLYEPGVCLDDVRRGALACTADHEFEVVGRVDLPADTAPPPPADHAGWDGLVGDTCRAQTRAYLGRDPSGSLVTDWLAIEGASWDAGLRTVHCVVGGPDGAGGWLTMRGSARDTPA